MRAFVVGKYGKDGLRSADVAEPTVGLYDAGTLRPTLDRTFPFDQTLDAMAYVEMGRARGKVVVVM